MVSGSVRDGTGLAGLERSDLYLPDSRPGCDGDLALLDGVRTYLSSRDAKMAFDGWTVCVSGAIGVDWSQHAVAQFKAVD